jgi:hypothetical protein
MRTSIFIRSYSKDFDWLVYCVRSIKKFCFGFRDVILVVPEENISGVPESVKQSVDMIFPVRDETHGYIAQQITKLRAHRYTDSEQILFVDSDCVMQCPCSPSDWMQDGKPVLLREHYDRLVGPQHGSVRKWKRITEDALGFEVHHEYMRRVPILFDRRTLEELEREYPSLVSSCLQVEGHEFSEFNVLGAFAAKKQPDMYSIVDVCDGMVLSPVAKQYWSWGGIESVIGEIRNTLGLAAGPSSRADIGSYLNKLGLTGFGCEIGTAYGENAEQVLRHWSGITLFCVDPWKKWPEGEYVDTTGKCDFDAMFMHAIRKFSCYPGRVSVVRQESDVAVKMFPDSFFDFVYIDGNHHEPQISLDLDNWYPKVKSGGLFCGHDYYDLDTPDYRCQVKSAVDAFVAKHGLALSVTEGAGDMSWWVQKP